MVFKWQLTLESAYAPSIQMVSEANLYMVNNLNPCISKEEVKLQRKLYQKLIESPVSPSSNLGASSQKNVYC